MRKSLLLFGALVISGLSSLAQDTISVQTFTYDSISTRRTTFSFPAEIENNQYEKVLMYYNIKCDPATPWDSYDCGEWDYFTNTVIYDHTGVLDSNEYTHPEFLVNGGDSSEYEIRLIPTYDFFQSYQYHIVYDAVNSETSGTIGTGAGNVNEVFG